MSSENTALKEGLILVTRPRHKANEFIKLIEQRGGSALAFPCIEIQPIELNDQLKKCLTSLYEMDLLIFISSNAVERFIRLIRLLGIDTRSINNEIATIGKATRAAAESAGLKVSLSPRVGFNSEALLALTELQQDKINTKKCLIIKGVGGLQQLADELQLRGAEVFYAEVYRREMPRQDGQVTRQQLSQGWANMKITTITSTSNESLQNLYDMLEPPGKHVMLTTQLVVASKRGYQLALTLGFKLVKVAKSATNQHMLEALVNG